MLFEEYTHASMPMPFQDHYRRRINKRIDLQQSHYENRIFALNKDNFKILKILANVSKLNAKQFNIVPVFLSARRRIYIYTSKIGIFGQTKW